MVKRNRIPRRNVLLAVLLAVVCVFGLCGFSIPPIDTPIKPDEINQVDKSKYSDVLTDLHKDASFDADKYPAVEGDYSLQVVQIAESESNELFVYVYQPDGQAQDVYADEIRLYMGSEADTPTDYPLTLLNSNGTLAKYLVWGLTVPSSSQRVYGIVQIARKWYDPVDGSAGDKNENVQLNNVYAVNSEWTVKTVNGIVTYFKTELKTVRITAKHVGRLVYIDESGIGQTVTHNFYVAMDTDIKIDTLLAADVSFEYGYFVLGQDEPARTYPRQIVSLYADDVNSANVGSFWRGGVKQHTWKDIQTTEEFIKSENLKDETELDGTQWVLRFWKMSEYQQKGGIGYYRPLGVTILDLTFITDGVTYKLGVVDNKTTGDKFSDNIAPQTVWDKFLAWVKKIMARLFGLDPATISDWVAVLFFILSVLIIITLLRIVIPLIAPFLPMIAKGIAKGFVYLFKGIWWFISLPVRGIIALVKRKRGDAD